jgi:RNA polymerase sigma-70 factor (ECF subfamily)
MNATTNAGSEEQELVARAKLGETCAFESIYQMYHAAIAASIHAVTRNAHDTEEVMQDTFVTAFFKLHRFRGSGSLEGWLRRIAINKCLDLFRKRKNLAVLDLEASTHQDDSTPLKDLQQSEFTHDFNEALCDMDPQTRDIFCLAVLERMPYAEIGRRQGVSVSAVKTRVFRARKQLQKSLLHHIEDLRRKHER